MAFDAYHKWLGIPAAEQPPDHYRLLSINLFENDPDVIESAADLRMSHLRKYQSGPHSALSQKLLCEVAAAKLCLLDQQKKAEYDSELRRRIDVATPKRLEVLRVASQRATSFSTQPAIAQPIPMQSDVLPTIISRSARLESKDNRQSRRGAIIAIGGGTLMLFFAGAMAVVLGYKSEKQTHINESASAPAADPSEPERAVADEPLADETPADRPRADNPGTAGSSPIAAAPSPPRVDIPSDADSGISPAKFAFDNNDEPDVKDAKNQPALPELNSAHVIKRQERLAIPDSATVARIRETLAKRFRADIERAKGPPQAAELTHQLLRESLKAGDDVAARYALLDLARTTAVAQGLSQPAFEALEVMAKEFAVDEISLMLDTLAASANKAAGVAAKEQQFDSALRLLDIAVAADRYAEATRALGFAMRATKGLGKNGLSKQIDDRKRRTEQLKKEFGRIKPQLAQLESHSNDANAHLVVGKFYCLLKGDWERGVPHLAAGSDEPLRTAAKLEMDGRRGANMRAAADAWWALSEGVRLAPQDVIAEHAKSCYRQALPYLTGDDKPTVDQRLKDIDLAIGKFLCFFKNDWNSGLPRLVEGSNATLKAAATLELAKPAGTGVLAVADAWYEARESADSSTEPMITKHAVSLYQSVLPHLAGDQKSAVERRLNDIYATARNPRAGSKMQFLSELSELNVVAWENWFFKGVDDRRQQLRIDGRTLPHSLLTHPLSKGVASATYQFAGKALRLSGEVSLDESSRRFRKTPLLFQVYGDGVLLWTSQPIQQSTNKFDVGVQNCNFVELRVLCGDWNGNAHTIWIEPTVTWK